LYNKPYSIIPYSTHLQISGTMTVVSVSALWCSPELFQRIFFCNKNTTKKHYKKLCTSPSLKVCADQQKNQTIENTRNVHSQAYVAQWNQEQCLRVGLNGNCKQKRVQCTMSSQFFSFCVRHTYEKTNNTGFVYLISTLPAIICLVKVHTHSLLL
jgi:hypothetical protein